MVMTRHRILLLVVAAVLVVSAIALGGCGMLVKKGIESATGVKVDQNQGSVSVTGKNGETATTQEGKVPDGFPADVPVYAGTVKMGNKVQTADGTTYQVVIETPDSAKTVGDFFEGKLKDSGWTIEGRNDSSSSGNDISTVSAKKDTSQAMVIASTNPDDKVTTVNVSITAK